MARERKTATNATVNANNVIVPQATAEDYVKLDTMSFEDWCEKVLDCDPSELEYADNDANPDHPFVLLDGERVGMIGDISGNKQLIVLQSRYDENGAYMTALKAKAESSDASEDDKRHYENARKKVFSFLMRSQFGDEPKGKLNDLLSGATNK